MPAGQQEPAAGRHALSYPVRPGCGMRLAELLSRQDEAAAGDPHSTVLRSTIFQRDDVVVRLIDVRGALDTADPAPFLGLSEPALVAELTTFPHGDLTRVLEAARMDFVTDRRSPDA